MNKALRNFVVEEVPVSSHTNWPGRLITQRPTTRDAAIKLLVDMVAAAPENYAATGHVRLVVREAGLSQLANR